MVNFTNWLTYRDRPVPDAKIATCPFKRLFKSTATSTNVQTGLSSFCDPPTPYTRARMLVHQYGLGESRGLQHGAMVENTGGR